MWDLDGAGRTRLRGGNGVFSVRPPGAWLLAAVTNFGAGIGLLSCCSHPGDRVRLQSSHPIRTGRRTPARTVLR
jgi:hypothetical protein